jgi:F-box and WD-40 domain protein MET30
VFLACAIIGGRWLLTAYQALDALPVEEREVVSSIWSNFSSSSHPRRALILNGLLTMCCFSQLSLLTENLQHLIRIDPFTVLPREVSLKILGYLDATSLCRAAQVTRKWRNLADDDILWRGICEQHIGQKCRKCGWGLPILEKKRTYRLQSPSSCSIPDPPSPKRSLDDVLDTDDPDNTRPQKRLRRDQAPHLDAIPPASHVLSQPGPTTPGSIPSCSSASKLLIQQPETKPLTATRPWKDVYSERMTVERNWRRGRYQVRTFKGHKDGVMCLQFSESFAHPSFPILISGSYDRTARVWNFETGAELHCLQGHTRVVRCLQFDEIKLITGSMDNTMRVWDWRRGKCIRILQGHTEGVLSLHFDNNVLASGSVDTTIKVWNLRTGGAFTLRGHSDWVNSVQLWDTQPRSSSLSPSNTSVFDMPGCAAPQIDPGKMLFSASDDGTIRLWDLTSRTCTRQFTGHMGQVQSMKLLLTDECEGDLQRSKDGNSQSPGSKMNDNELSTDALLRRKKPVLISGSLDNTIKVWDLDTGKAVQTLFGHIEGVWGVASDKMRLVSASHDRTIKVSPLYLLAWIGC